MIRVIRSIDEMKQWCREQTGDGCSLGFVPTMGALHAGHRSLLERARSENDRAAASIFVNPTQYDDPEDLENYPRTFDADVEMLESAGIDALFFPSDDSIYPTDYRYRVTENQESELLEGAHRNGHFDGVLTIVLKLLLITRPTRAYFGEKDWQQYILVRDMVKAFFLDTEIIGCPTVREADGLALSSRNVHLDPEQRKIAPRFHSILSSGAEPGEQRRQLEAAGFEVDYVEKRWGRVLGAVRLGETRLIDNVPL